MGLEQKIWPKHQRW